MSVTYPADPAKPYGDRLEMPRVDPHAELTNDEPFVPVYARRGKARAGQSKIRAWMILVPAGAIALGGIGALMLMGGNEEAATPLAEPAAPAPVLSAPAAPTPLTAAATPAPVVTAPPVVRETAPVRRAAPAPAPRRDAARVQAPAAPARVVVPAPAVGPRPYAPATAASPTTTLNAAPATPPPTAARTPEPPPPPIVVAPLG